MTSHILSHDYPRDFKTLPPLSTALRHAPFAMDDLGLPWAAEEDAGIPFLSETEFHELWGGAGSPGGGGGGGSGAPPPSFSGLRCLDSTHADECKMCAPRTLRCASVAVLRCLQFYARAVLLSGVVCRAPSCPRALGHNLASPPLLLRPPTLASNAAHPTVAIPLHLTPPPASSRSRATR